MDIGITTGFSHLTPAELIVSTAQQIEAAGFSTVWVPEHVLFFPEYSSAYPYSDDGRVPGNPDGVLDPFTALTFIAAHTSTLRLGTGICLVPQRQPAYTAKMVADVDYLSGGRVDFGVGVGWLEEEFVALGVDFAARGRLCDEYLQAMKALWGDDPVTFHGPTVTINNAQANPKPVQRPHPPIFIGGESAPAMRRAASLADGWYAFNLLPAELEAKLAVLDGHLAEAGRSRDDLRLVVSPGQTRVSREVIAAYESLGVEQVVLGVFGRNADDIERGLTRLVETAGI